MPEVGFEPTHPKIIELKSTALDHSAIQAYLLYSSYNIIYLFIYFYYHIIIILLLSYYYHIIIIILLLILLFIYDDKNKYINAFSSYDNDIYISYNNNK